MEHKNRKVEHRDCTYYGMFTSEYDVPSHRLTRIGITRLQYISNAIYDNAKKECKKNRYICTILGTILFEAGLVITEHDDYEKYFDYIQWAKHVDQYRSGFFQIF